MNALLKTSIIGLVLLTLVSTAQAQTQSTAPADKALAKKISTALVTAGIDPRTTSVHVTTTADHTVVLTGLISDKNTIKLAGDVATKNAPGYKVINKINSSFFDDPNHNSGGQDK